VKVVPDTNVLVSGLLNSKGNPAAILTLFGEHFILKPAISLAPD
jgi:predicted nucleic acid-binding protein